MYKVIKTLLNKEDGYELAETYINSTTDENLLKEICEFLICKIDQSTFSEKIYYKELLEKIKLRLVNFK